MVWLVLISEFLISISSGPKKNISLFRRLGSNLICGFLIFICLKKLYFLSLQGPNLICGANERNFVQQQMTSWQTARGENQEIFSPKLFIKTTNSISDERVRISIFYPRALWQIKSGTMMDRIIPPSLKSNPNSPFSKCLSITNPTICSRSALQLYKSNLFNPFAGSRKYLNHPYVRNTNSWCSQILQVIK